MIEPYWYQADCLTAIARARRQGRVNILFTMASGLGKTVTVALDAFRYREANPNAKFLYLCHQNEILVQARSIFEAVHGSKHTFGFYNCREKTAHDVQFLFASLQTMRKHHGCFRQDEFEYISVDESHHTYADTYLDVVTRWQPKTMVGMTATPDRTDGQDIRRVFGKEVFYLPLDDALAQDLLTPVDYRLLTDEIQLKEVLEKTEHRLSITKLNRTIFVPKRDEEIARIINKHSDKFASPRIIIFCESVRHCDHLAGYIEGGMPFHSRISDRERIFRLEMFRQGMVRALITRDVFNEGIDIPQANVLVFLRSTNSPTIFLQQLGRGLRKSDGKDKVTVLDFVGNCERIRMITNLWESVEKKRKVLLEKATPEKSDKAADSPEPLMLNVSSTGFREKIIKILDIIGRKTGGYSKDDVISSLKAFAQQLGRSPTQMEVHENFDMPSLSAYRLHFGTYSKALIGSGLAVNQMLNVSRKELLEQLRRLQNKLGHAPSQDEVGEASKKGLCSSEPIFRKEFGSLNNALEAAGLSPERLIGKDEKTLIEEIRNLHQVLKRVPTVADVTAASKAGKGASQTVFNRRFGSWNKALEAAGLKPVHIAKSFKVYSKAEVYEQFKTLRAELGRLPSTLDIIEASKQNRCPSLSTVYKYFGRIAVLQNTLALEK